jgi:hypothetical protein
MQNSVSDTIAILHSALRNRRVAQRAQNWAADTAEELHSAFRNCPLVQH